MSLSFLSHEEAVETLLHCYAVADTVVLIFRGNQNDTWGMECTVLQRGDYWCILRPAMGRGTTITVNALSPGAGVGVTDELVAVIDGP